MPLSSIPVRLSDDRPAQFEFRPSTLRVAERLYEHLRSRRTSYRPGRVYASEITNCARKQAMGIMGFEPAPIGEDNPEWVVAADMGTWLHGVVEGWLKEVGGLVKSEFRVQSKDGAVSGRVDALLSDVGEYCALVEIGEQYILDVKTVSDRDFKAGANGRKIPGYVAQISVYGRLTGVKNGIILLVNRNNGALADLEFTIDFDYADHLLARAARIVQSAEDRVLPPAEAWTGEDGSFYCKKLCPFYKECAKYPETEFALEE